MFPDWATVADLERAITQGIEAAEAADGTQLIIVNPESTDDAEDGSDGNNDSADGDTDDTLESEVQDVVQPSGFLLVDNDDIQEPIYGTEEEVETPSEQLQEDGASEEEGESSSYSSGKVSDLGIESDGFVIEEKIVGEDRK